MLPHPIHLPLGLPLHFVVESAFEVAISSPLERLRSLRPPLEALLAGRAEVILSSCTSQHKATGQISGRELGWIPRELARAENILQSYYKTKICGIAGKSTEGSYLAIILLIIHDLMAEREGFEPPIALRPCRFSRPEPSTTRPPLRNFLVLFDCTSNRAYAATHLQACSLDGWHIDLEIRPR